MAKADNKSSLMGNKLADLKFDLDSQVFLKTSEATLKTYTYNYIDLPSIFKIIKPFLKKHKIELVQYEQDIKPTVHKIDNSAFLEKVLHTSFICNESNSALISEDRHYLVSLTSRTNTISQCEGSAETYTRRYAICCLLNICGVSDDDGKANNTENKRENLEKYYNKKYGSHATQSDEKDPW